MVNQQIINFFCRTHYTQFQNFTISTETMHNMHVHKQMNVSICAHPENLAASAHFNAIGSGFGECKSSGLDFTRNNECTV